MSDAVINLFAERSDSYDRGNWPKDPELLSIHKRLVGEVTDKKILDAACGTGIVGGLFAQSCSVVVGVDLSPEMLVQASNRVSVCVQADISQMPFLEDTFDLILCRQALHYVDPLPVLREFKRVLKFDGRLLVSSIVPYGEVDLLWLSKRAQIQKPEQVWVPTRDSIFAVLRSAGFEHVNSIDTQTHSKLSITDGRTEHERLVREELFRHYADATDVVKSLYKMRLDDNEIEYWNDWVIALFQVA